MKRSLFVGKAVVGTATCVMALALCWVATAQQAEPQKVEPPAKVQVGNFQLSGPYTHENITIYLIHGEDKLKGKAPLTLDEALEQKKVVVHETGNVNELSVENVSDDDVFIQSGDIVKGGRQDRVVQHDIILPPKSGKLSLASFCVESGRWRQRGGEEARYFSSSTEQLPTKDLKIANRQAALPNQSGQPAPQNVIVNNNTATPANPPALPPNGPGNAPNPPPGPQRPAVATPAAPQAQPAGPNRPAGQSEVWKRVAEAQDKLAMNAGASVQSTTSASSLQLSLEHKKLLEAIDANVKKLSAIIEGKNDVIGYTFAINGKVNGADMYASSAFFRKVWPKLVKATVVEALAEQQKDKKFEPAGIEAFKTFLADGEKEKAKEMDITARTQSVYRQTEKTLQLETRRQGAEGHAGDADE